MTELIWIGNTLYPRWVVFTALGLAIFVAVIVVRAIFSLFKGEDVR